MDKIYFTTLNNKLNVIFINNKSTDLVMSTVNISVGSNMETPINSGIAHVLEHMLFHNKFKNADITKHLHSISAHFNAATSYDQTNYYIISNKNDCCESIDMLFSIYLNNSFTDNDLIKEKRIVLEEYGLTYNNISQLIIKDLFKDLFGKDISENLFVIGNINSINKISKNDIVNYKKFYLPELTTILMIGNFNSNLVLNTLKQTFGKINNNFSLSNNVLNNKIQFKLNSGFFKYIPSPNSKSQCLILFAFKTVNYFHKDKFIDEMLKNMLNYFILFEKLRLDSGNTYTSRSSLYNTKDFGLFCIDTQVAFRYLFPVLKTIVHIFKDLKTNLVSQDLINRTYKKLKISSDLIFQDFREYHKFYNQQAIFVRNKNDIITPNQFLNICKNISPNDIKRVANNIFDKNHTYLTIFGPGFKQYMSLAEILNHF